MMSRKNYTEAVSVIKECHPDLESRTLAAVPFVMLFQRDNPRFDKDRFMQALVDEPAISNKKR